MLPNSMVADILQMGGTATMACFRGFYDYKKWTFFLSWFSLFIILQTISYIQTLIPKNSKGTFTIEAH
jgi:hypothetical protein